MHNRVKYTIFGLLLWSCTTNDCMITVSPLNPVEFWPIDCATHNQDTTCGVHHKCFCQPFECDDLIKVGIEDTDWENDYRVGILNESESELGSFELSKTILYDGEIINFANEEFTSTLTPWSSLAGSGRTNAVAFQWAAGGYAQAAYVAESQSDITRYFAIQRSGSTPGWPPGTYQVKINAKNNSNLVSGSGDSVGAGVYGMANATSQTFLSQTASAAFPNDNTFHEITIDFTTDQYWLYLAFAFDQQGGGGTFEIDITVDYIRVTASPGNETKAIYTGGFIPSFEGVCDEKVQLVIYETGSPEIPVYHSDCLDIRTTWQCTKLVTYGNARQFAGLNFDSGSPQNDFAIRIPAVFYHERFPKEKTIFSLVGSLVTQSATVKAQKMLDVDFVPNYLHRKLQLILSCQFISIDDIYWVDEEGYEMVEGNKRSAFKKGMVYLTQRDFVQRNVL